MSTMKQWVHVVVEIILTLLLITTVILFVNYLSSKSNDEMGEAITTTNNVPKADFDMFDNKVVPGSLVRLAIDNYSKDFIVSVSSGETSISVNSSRAYLYTSHYGRFPIFRGNPSYYSDKFATSLFYFTPSGSVSDYISSDGSKWDPSKSYITADISPYHVTDGKYQKYNTSGGNITSYVPTTVSMPPGFKGLPQINTDKNSQAINI